MKATGVVRRIDDLGRIGEYLSYKKLKSYESLGAKFLFNVYVPKEKGETSEIYVTLDYHDYLSLEVECYEYKWQALSLSSSYA
mgnify:CR=1 FL=1